MSGAAQIRDLVENAVAALTGKYEDQIKALEDRVAALEAASAKPTAKAAAPAAKARAGSAGVKGTASNP